ncbi:DUF2339 domain-containing protein [Aquimarina algicola]|uniref:DUF2339 domain-containing protein n=1 Tax=Aquimarina algicola TaxID=2589995 RepID=A0A504JA11_9FLAO|nr:DUF2339 domain-containing protein [Aquimarina algicola]TPN85362.1 DUF2339 domain-containing protein [Aquimarina algicola]
MGDRQEQILRLIEKLEVLSKKQESFSIEIQNLKEEIFQLKKITDHQEIVQEEEKLETKPVEEVKPIPKPISQKEEPVTVEPATEKQISTATPSQSKTSKVRPPKRKSNLEKFIGENLISKIGVIIIIIGVAIGAKYSIENDLISPLTRIILGYVTGIALLIIGMRLKKKYKNFSAVLVSGAMTIMYFITFLAYNLYELIPQTFTFVLMVVFTAFTVLAAINYNKQVIAHIGLVGAYAVPFLLSDGSGRVEILFGYMAIINIGILAIAVTKYWKSLYFSSFILTWIIFLSWFGVDYDQEKHFALSLIFVSVFFFIFYLVFLVYKLRKKETFGTLDVILQLSNSFIFYGLGFGILSDHEIGKELLGLFTLINAIIHFTVSTIVYKLKLADRNLFYFAAGMVLVFITIAFPVQLDGNWVTLLWAGEGALLFWIGRSKKVRIYEVLSYPLWALAFFSLTHDWYMGYYRYVASTPETRLIPVFNIYMLTSVLSIVAFGVTYYINRKFKDRFPWPKQMWFHTLLTISLGILVTGTTYIAFWLEIDNYWDQVRIDIREMYSGTDYDYYRYTSSANNSAGIWLINYTLLFMSIFSFVNIKKIKNDILAYVTFGLLLLSVFSFLTTGLYLLSELRETYLLPSNPEGTVSFMSNIGIRYISFGFMALILYTFYVYTRQSFLGRTFKIFFSITLHFTLLWILSSELIHWLDFSGYTETYKLGLSILWGVYCLFLIILGIWKKKKYLRILAIVWFSITLLKLFFYDISHLNTISKTIVFLSLGVLLLVISFLYNKYKHVISDEKDS